MRCTPNLSKTSFFGSEKPRFTSSEKCNKGFAIVLQNVSITISAVQEKTVSLLRCGGQSGATFGTRGIFLERVSDVNLSFTGFTLN